MLIMFDDSAGSGVLGCEMLKTLTGFNALGFTNLGGVVCGWTHKRSGRFWGLLELERNDEKGKKKNR